MKRLRSYDDELGSVGEKEVVRTTSFLSSHHRRYYSKGSENGRNRPSPVIDEDREREGSSSRGRNRMEHDLDGFDEREGFRGFRKRGDHEFSSEGGFEEREGFRGGERKRLDHENEGFERRKGFDRRHRDRDGMVGLSPRGGDRDRDRERERERIHRSDSFCLSRRDFPKGFRSERHLSRREDGSLSSWRRFDSRSRKDVDEDCKSSPVEKGGSSSSKGMGPDSGGVSSGKESLRSPQQGLKDVRSPTWSKDSTRDSKESVGEPEPEPSKDTKKNNDSMVADSAPAVGSGSEMEEGELQPELNQIQGPKDQVVSESNGEQHALDPQVDSSDIGKKLQDLEATQMVESRAATVDMKEATPGKSKFVIAKEGNVAETLNKFIKAAEKMNESNNTANDEIMKAAEKFSTTQQCPVDKVPGSEETEVSVTTANDRTLTEKQPELSAPTNMSFDGQMIVEEHDLRRVDRPSQEKENPKNNFDLEVGLGESSKAIVEEVHKKPESSSVPVLKDKGKGLAVSSPSEGDTSIRENSLPVERNFIACQDDTIEGSSVRGFELFSSSAGVKVGSANKSSGSKSKPEAKKLKMESLDLSLGLPNVSVPAASQSAAAAAPPSSPPRAMSLQSFGTTLRTGSDCFTTSISFSGSQFIHNPSCSLTHNSADYDFEQSVKSRPLFQGVDWQALSANDSLPKEVLANSKSVSNGNGNGNGNGSLQFTQSSQGKLNGRAVQQQPVPIAMDRSGYLQRQSSGTIRYQDDFKSPAQSDGSHHTRSEYGKDKKRMTGEESVSRLFRSSSQREMENGHAGERELVERLMYLIAFEQIQTMAWRVNEMPERSVAFLKDSVCEVILKEDNHRKLRALQDVLRKRSDLNLETLLKSHRVQLQILLALKTGLPEFIQHADSISSSDLAEIYLGLKCRNINCRSALPVDDCDCKLCSQKDGYCSSCMCVVCSKFDTAANTCGWVGCDVCNHWCHTDCGLLKSYIRNGHSAAGAQGMSEMQFYCLACDHPSEMFGFVKDVFKTCATEWKTEVFLRELEYVRRIFSSSNDYKGKVLHDIAKQLIGRLQSGAKTADICNQILAIINESDANAVGSSGRDQAQAQAQPHPHPQPQPQPQHQHQHQHQRQHQHQHQHQRQLQHQHQHQPQSQPQPQPQSQSLENNRVNVQDAAIVLSHEPIWSKSNYAKEISQMENTGTAFPSIEGSAVGGGSWSNKTGDELDIVKLKLAEAQLFQKRADAARKEAEALQCIVSAKNEKVEKEYGSRTANLLLSEVEERRRVKHEELKLLERSHREYFNMKTRMESDIKGLLFKMEATRRNLNTQYSY